jgi:hypothetical protein
MRTRDRIWYDIGVLIGTAVKAVAAVRRLVRQQLADPSST